MRQLGHREHGWDAGLTSIHRSSPSHRRFSPFFPAPPPPLFPALLALLCRLQLPLIHQLVDKLSGRVQPPAGAQALRQDVLVAQQPDRQLTDADCDTLEDLLCVIPDLKQDKKVCGHVVHWGSLYNVVEARGGVGGGVEWPQVADIVLGAGVKKNKNRGNQLKNAYETHLTRKLPEGGREGLRAAAAAAARRAETDDGALPAIAGELPPEPAAMDAVGEAVGDADVEEEVVVGAGVEEAAASVGETDDEGDAAGASAGMVRAGKRHRCPSRKVADNLPSPTRSSKRQKPGTAAGP